MMTKARQIELRRAAWQPNSMPWSDWLIEALNEVERLQELIVRSVYGHAEEDFRVTREILYDRRPKQNDVPPSGDPTVRRACADQIAYRINEDLGVSQDTKRVVLELLRGLY